MLQERLLDISVVAFCIGWAKQQDVAAQRCRMPNQWAEGDAPDVHGCVLFEQAFVIDVNRYTFLCTRAPRRGGDTGEDIATNEVVYVLDIVSTHRDVLHRSVGVQKHCTGSFIRHWIRPPFALRSI